MAMIFTMPERNAMFRFWSDEELEGYVQAYASQYESEIASLHASESDDQFEWAQEELVGMDFVMQACSVMDGIPVEVWDKFHTRWREIYLLQMNIVVNPNYDTEVDAAAYMAARLADFFDEDDGWLQKRPNND